jgi:hypothetical protein
MTLRAIPERGKEKAIPGFLYSSSERNSQIRGIFSLR